MKKPDPFQYIRDYYRVPARKEQRVSYTDHKETKTGRICGARDQYIRIHFDGEAKPHPGVFHPVDGIEYLPTPAQP